MAQEQPRRESAGPNQEPIKYGDVFFVSGQVAVKPVLPEDAAAMESAEKTVLGHSPLGGPASMMHSAATLNVQSGLVNPGERDTNQGIRVTESEVDGKRVITESVGDEVVGQYVEPKFAGVGAPPARAPVRDPVTIGEALEAVTLSAGDEPVDKADAAAIEAAEKRALGTDVPPTDGLGAQAQLAAALNAQAAGDGLRTTLDDILQDAANKLPCDKPVSREDAEEIVKAEIRNDPEMATTIGGVGEMMATAARVNQL